MFDCVKKGCLKVPVTHSILSDYESGNCQKSVPNTSGLRPFTAPDTSGGTVPLAAKISSDDRDWLDSLPEGRSYHVRQAIKLYRESRKASQSFERQQPQQLPDFEIIRQLVLEDAKTWVNVPAYHSARSALEMFIYYLQHCSGQ